MLPVHVAEVRACTITMGGIQWKITKAADSVVVDGELFVRMAATSWTLMHCVYHGLEDRPSSPTLGTNHGLARLIEMRNKAQAEYLSNSAAEGQCKLFEQKLKRARVTHAKQADLRETPQSMTLDVIINGTVHKVEVLRPVHPKDNLFAACRPEVLAPILHVMRTEGFDDPIGRARDLPPGIQRRKNKFMVRYRKPDGKWGWKSRSSIEDAIAFKADVESANVDDASDEGADEYADQMSEGDEDMA